MNYGTEIKTLATLNMLKKTINILNIADHFFILFSNEILYFLW